MPSFGAEVSHTLGKEEATSRLTGFADRLRDKYQDRIKDLQETWNEDGSLSFAFKTMGLTVSGDILVDDEVVKLDGQLPFAAIVFKGKIEEEIRNQLERVLKE